MGQDVPFEVIATFIDADLIAKLSEVRAALHVEHVPDAATLEDTPPVGFHVDASAQEAAKRADDGRRDLSMLLTPALGLADPNDPLTDLGRLALVQLHPGAPPSARRPLTTRTATSRSR